ncbi:Molecular chaperone DnaK [uncultured Desulfobacterium sp.]|uniref:Molecular chaperone DnaK n=1 Tax=uncultured Desulfobacterium sp. TaxID=201089 RepID=A0A445MWE5_9BACT|nr:Molecular chaperone DnaK [uncultured Desulfobacterium sp.]
MMDDADQADIFAERYRKGYLAAQAERTPKGKSAEICEDCGAIIPLPRREAVPGCTRCLECQTEFEKER